MTPNKGFTLSLPSSFVDENFPNSAQTQVIGINNSDDTVGFYIDQAGTTHGFFKDKGKDPVSVDLPGTTFNQLLGINNKDQAAGYFQDTASPAPLQHAYIHEKNGDFRVLGNLPMPSSQATGINDKGDIVGFLQQSTADTQSSGFLLKANGKLEVLNVKGSTFTQALGVNNDDDVVGLFQDGNGVLHGFLYRDGKFETINAPGSASTVINGINKRGEIVGFFTDANGNTVGLVGEPKR
jgi:probable HAF family extracellular repeat protein